MGEKNIYKVVIQETPMSKAISDICDSNPNGKNRKQIGAFLNISQPTLTKYCSGESTFPALKIPYLTVFTGNGAIIEYLLNETSPHLKFIGIQKIKDIDTKAISTLVIRRMDATREIIKANSDGKVTKKEAVKLRKALMESVKESLAYYDSLEEIAEGEKCE